MSHYRSSITSFLTALRINGCNALELVKPSETSASSWSSSACWLLDNALPVCVGPALGSPGVSDSVMLTCLCIPRMFTAYCLCLFLSSHILHTQGGSVHLVCINSLWLWQSSFGCFIPSSATDRRWIILIPGLKISMTWCISKCQDL